MIFVIVCFKVMDSCLVLLVFMVVLIELDMIIVFFFILFIVILCKGKFWFFVCEICIFCKFEYVEVFFCKVLKFVLLMFVIIMN